MISLNVFHIVSTRGLPPNRLKAQILKNHVSTSPLGEAQLSWMRRLSSVRDTENLGHIIGKKLFGGEVIALFGDLGTGKTAFVRGLASSLGIPSDEVTSPTFTLIHEYRGRLPLIHVDLYRIEKIEELHQIGIQEYCNQDTTIVIEWANRMGSQLPQDHLAVHLQHATRNSRKATITATGSQSRRLLAEVRSQYPSNT